VPGILTSRSTGSCSWIHALSSANLELLLADREVKVSVESVRRPLLGCKLSITTHLSLWCIGPTGQSPQVVMQVE